MTEDSSVTSNPGGRQLQADAKARLDERGGFASMATVTRKQIQEAFDDLQTAWQEDILAAGIGKGPGPNAPLGIKSVWHPVEGTFTAMSIYTFTERYPGALEEDNAVLVSEFVAGSELPHDGTHDATNYSFVLPYTTVHPQEHGDIAKVSVVFPNDCVLEEGDGVQLIFIPK